MRDRRLTLVDQNYTQQLNGLVQVNASFVAVASEKDRVMPLFSTDSQPPLPLTIVDTRQLQTNRLYLRDMNCSQQNGLLTIEASYVGANYAALAKPAIFSDYETRTFLIVVSAGYVTQQINLSGLSGGSIGSSMFVVYDYYQVRCQLRVERQEAAIIGNEAIDYNEPPFASDNRREGIFMGATFVTRPQLYNTAGADFQPLGGFEYRTLSATELVQRLILNPNTSGNFSVSRTRQVDHITPLVKAVSDTYQAQIPDSSQINAFFP